MGYRVGSFNRSEASAAVPQSKLGISPAKHVLSEVEGAAKAGHGNKMDCFTGGNGDNRDELKNFVSSVVSC